MFLFFPRYENHPKFQDKNFVNQIKENLGCDRFSQEFECKFNLVKDDPVEMNRSCRFSLGISGENWSGTYFTNNVSIDGNVLKVSLYSAQDPELVDNWVFDCQDKRLDFDIKFSDDKGKIKNSFLILNAKLINKKIELSYSSVEPVTWELTFEHSYFGPDKPIGQIERFGKKYNYYHKINNPISSFNQYVLLSKKDYEELASQCENENIYFTEKHFGNYIFKM